MYYRIHKISEDAETRQKVLILRQADSEDLLALNVAPKEAVVLGSLLADDGLPNTEVLEHLRDSASRSTGDVIGIRLLAYRETESDAPALTPLLIMRSKDSQLEQAIPASLAHAAAWSITLDLPIEIDEGLLEALQATVTVIPGEAPSGFRQLLEGLEEIDSL